MKERTCAYASLGSGDLNRQRVAQRNARWRDRCVVAYRLDPCIARRSKSGGIGGVEVGGEFESGAIGALHEIEHHRAVALGNDVGQIAQMLGAACCDAVGKLSPIAIAAQMDVLDLNIGVRQARFGQKEIDAAVGTVFDLWPDGPISGKLGYRTGQ